MSDTLLQGCDIGVLQSSYYVESTIKTYYEPAYKEILACDGSCLNCLGPTADDCISCNSGFYLNKADSKNRYGACTAKIVGSTTVELTIKTSNVNLVVDRDGTPLNPFVDLQNALIYVSEFLGFENNMFVFRGWQKFQNMKQAS